jgi:hypothetical protein
MNWKFKKRPAVDEMKEKLYNVSRKGGTQIRDGRAKGTENFNAL